MSRKKELRIERTGIAGLCRRRKNRLYMERNCYVKATIKG